MAERGVVRSRSLAQDLIRRGEVTVNDVVISKPSAEVTPEDVISITNPMKFVSRAGEKLEHALSVWKIDVSGLTVVDIGASTGGFTDCLLQRGAEKVIAIDVGKQQLEAGLFESPKVEVHEDTDVRRFSLPSPVDMAVIDVSFISLSHVLGKAHEFVKPKSSVIALVKPQFEVGRKLAHKRKGVIRNIVERENALKEVEAKAKEIGFKIVKHIDSSIEGESGNREFLLLLEKK